MSTAKLFRNGQSQAVRLPKEFRFNGDHVGIRKLGDIVYLFPPEKAWDLFMEGVNEFDNDFAIERDNQPPDREVDL